MARSLFPRDMFAELDRLQREMQQAFELTPTIRGIDRGGYPALNIGSTPATVEVYAFAPGLDPASIEVQIDRGLLSISGNRPAAPPAADGKATVRINERFAGAFSRAVSLPDDIDPDAVEAHYRHGVLHLSIRRRESAQPRRITIQ
jgi:HSP20 family protein